MKTRNEAEKQSSYHSRNATEPKQTTRAHRENDGSITRELKREILRQKLAEKGLLKGHNKGKKPIGEQTSDLTQANKTLRQEICEPKQSEQLLQHRTKELTLLNNAGKAMTSTLDLNTVLARMMVEVNNLFEAAGASVLLYDSGRDDLVFAATATPDAQALIGQRLPVTAGIAGWVMKAKRSISVEDAQEDPRFYDRVDTITGLTTKSLLATPLIIKDRIMGVVEIINGEKAIFDQNDLETLEALASSAAIAIENARLYAEIERRTNQLTVLNELDRALTTSHRLCEIYDVFHQHTRRLLSYDRMSIALLGEKEIQVVHAAGEDENLLPVGTKLPCKTSAIGWVIDRGQPLLRHIITTDTRFYEDDELVAKGIQSSLIIPLRFKGRIIGAWNLDSRRRGAYHADDLELSQSMADQLAITVENARLFEQVRSGREQLRRLAQQVVSAQEDERQRLSQELHDEAGQSLIALKMTLELIQMDLPAEADALGEQLDEAVKLADTTMERLRSVARDLRPPALDTVGLNPTLEGLCRDFATWTKLPIDYVGTDLTTLTDSANISMYRILQEALTNVAKHAQAHQVGVKLEASERFVSLTVQDDGQGFDKQILLGISDQPNGIGLLGMQERLEQLGGRLELETSPGQGTCLRAYIPWEGS